MSAIRAEGLTKRSDATLAAERLDTSAEPAEVHGQPGPEGAGSPTIVDSGSAVIRTDGLVKDYGDHRVVDGLSFSVPPGVVAGFVGPNGAGKTTTIRMLLGLVRPTSGTADVLGRSIEKPVRYAPAVGALIESPAFYPTLSGRQNLETLATLGGFPRERINEVLGIVELADRGGDHYKTYSLGMKQRLGIAAALLGEPQLLVLDEPANGLDPQGILDVRRLLHRLADSGVTVFVSSHLLAEVEQIANWLVIISRGRLVFDGPLADAIDQQRGQLVVAPERSADLERVVRLAAATGYETRLVDGELRVDAPPDFAAVLNRAATEAGVTLRELHHHRPTLEEVFFSVTQGRPT
jgi:ABC-2 type transport system ATP-binding protein